MNETLGNYVILHITRLPFKQWHILNTNILNSLCQGLVSHGFNYWFKNTDLKVAVGSYQLLNQTYALGLILFCGMSEVARILDPKMSHGPKKVEKTKKKVHANLFVFTILQ